MSASHICMDVGLATGAWETYLSLKEECLPARELINCQRILRKGGAWRSIAGLILYESCKGNCGSYKLITVIALTFLNLTFTKIL